MVDNNRANTLTCAACMGRLSGTGNIAQTRTHQLSDALSSGFAMASSGMNTQG